MTLEDLRSLKHRWLTPFQELMQEWAALAPFNFAHAIRLPEPADVPRWQRAVTAVVGAAVTPIETPSSGIEVHLTAEVQRPFAGDGNLPLRFFTLAAPEGGHWFGVVIDHWLADDFSGRALLEQIYAAYRTGMVETGETLRFVTAQSPRTSWFAEWLAFAKEAWRYRCACRLPLDDALDFGAETFHTKLPVEALPIIRTLAKHEGVTVHDVFLAATAQVFGARQAQQMDRRRHSIALTSAMDARRFETGAARTGFGLLLAQYAVFVRDPQTFPRRQVLQCVAAQTQALKAKGGTDVFRVLLLAWRATRSRRAKATLFARAAPVSAGLSNINLTGSWLESPEIGDYRRVASPSAGVPMVLMITTWKGRILIDTTFRTTAFARSEAEEMVGAIAQWLLSPT